MAGNLPLDVHSHVSEPDDYGQMQQGATAAWRSALSRIYRSKSVKPTDAKTLLLEALRGFVDQYDTDRRTWPDDMVELLDNAYHAIKVATVI